MSENNSNQTPETQPENAQQYNDGIISGNQAPVQDLGDVQGSLDFRSFGK